MRPAHLPDAERHGKQRFPGEEGPASGIGPQLVKGKGVGTQTSAACFFAGRTLFAALRRQIHGPQYALEERFFSIDTVSCRGWRKGLSRYRENSSLCWLLLLSLVLPLRHKVKGKGKVVGLCPTPCPAFCKKRGEKHLKGAFYCGFGGNLISVFCALFLLMYASSHGTIQGPSKKKG